MTTDPVTVTPDEQIDLDAAYERHTVTRRYEVPTPEDPTGVTIVLVVHYSGPGWGYDVWVGNRDGVQNMGGCATEHSALWYASNYAPEARPDV